MTRVAIYARYSSDNQRDASIEDQLRLCREHAEQQSWQVIECYADHAISGSSLLRPGIQKLLTDAAAYRFDVILAEALDRLSRDQEDIAGLHKRMRFAGVRIVTLSEGEISNLYVGLQVSSDLCEVGQAVRFVASRFADYMQFRYIGHTGLPQIGELQATQKMTCTHVGALVKQKS